MASSLSPHFFWPTLYISESDAILSSVLLLTQAIAVGRETGKCNRFATARTVHHAGGRGAHVILCILVGGDGDPCSASKAVFLLAACYVVRTMMMSERDAAR